MGQLHREPRSAFRLVVLGIAVAGLTLVTGCDSTAKINEARPVQNDVAQLWDSLLVLHEDANERALLEREHANRLAARALACSGGYEPWFFSSRETIRKELTDTKCFEDADRDLREWISAEALKTLSSMPPLRPLPEEVPQLIAASNSISDIKFASQAGVAVITSSGQSHEVIDIATNDTLFLEDDRQNLDRVVSISPNGRLFAVLAKEGNGIAVRDSTNGNTLADFPDFTRFQWLDSDIVVAEGPRDRVMVLDLRSGTSSIVKGATNSNVVVTRAGKPLTYFSFSGSSLFEVQIRRDAQSINARLVRDVPLPSRSAYTLRGEPAVKDGQIVLSVADGVMSIDVATLAAQLQSLSPLYVQSVMPLPRPGEFLLTIRDPQSRSGQLRYVVFFADEQKFAAATDPLFEVPNALAGQHLFYVHSLKRVGVQGAKSLRLIDKVSYGPKMTAQALVALSGSDDVSLADSDALAALARARGSAAYGPPVPGRVGGVDAQAVGPLPQLAAGAQIEAIGVYESASGTRGFREHRPAPVQVIVRRTSKPLVLVLSSYEPVIWQISSPTGGANIKAVLVGGYDESTVNGAGNARVIKLGNVYAYKRESAEYFSLQQEVGRWTGRSIDVFQGAYKASSFTIGGP